MVGGKYHSPLWTPYALYAEIDYVYGWKALQENNSWTQTQTWFNLGEVLAYAVYLGWVLGGGGVKGSGRRILEGRTLEGRRAAWAVLVGFSAASLTFYKTVMYCMFFFPFFFPSFSGGNGDFFGCSLYELTDGLTD